MTRKAAAKNQKIQLLAAERHALFLDRLDREGEVPAAGGDDRRGDRADQHQQRADQGVDHHLQRRLRRRRPAFGRPVHAPGAEEEVERHQHQVEEEDEEQQVLGEERAQRRGLRRQHQEEEELRALLLAEGGEGDPAGPEHRGQQHEEEVEAVDAEAVVDAEPGDPGRVDGVLQAGGAVVEAEGHDHGDHQRHQRARGRPPADDPLRQEEADDAEREGCPEERVDHDCWIRK